jgi:hypothetical protein
MAVIDQGSFGGRLRNRRPSNSYGSFTGEFLVSLCLGGTRPEYSSRRPNLKPIDPKNKRDLERGTDEQMTRSSSVSLAWHTPDGRVNICRQDTDEE